MGNIPNTSESPYYLRRIQGRSAASADPSAPRSQHSLRSIPAWDANYLGSSLLAKRVRKTLAVVEDRINAVATGGVDYTLLEQMIRTALDGMDLDGLDEAEVNALIAAAVSEFGDTLTAEVGTAIQALIDGGQLGSGGSIDEAAVQALIDAAVAGIAVTGVDAQAVQAVVAAALAQPFSGPLLVTPSITAGVAGDTAEVVAFSPANQPINLDLQAPGGKVTVNGAPLMSAADVQDKVVALLNTSPTIGSPQLVNPRIEGVAFTPDGNRILGFKQSGFGETWLTVSSGNAANPPQIGTDGVQGVQHIDIQLRPKGFGKVTVHGVNKVATVAADGPWPDTDLNLEPLGEGKVTVKGSAVITEQALGTIVGPAIQQAVASQVGVITDKLLLNSTQTADGQVVIETNNLTSAQWKVGVNFVTQRDGEISINGNRVLTTADALAAGGAGIDQAALEAAVQAATAPLLARIDALETELANKADKTQLGVNAAGQALATQMSVDTALAAYVTVDALDAKVSEIENTLSGLGSAQELQVVTEALQEYATLNDVKVQAATTNIQEIFDVFAGQEGGSIRQLQSFYTNLTGFLLDAMTAFSKFGQADSATAAVETFLSEVNDVVGNLVAKTDELTQMDAQIVEYVTQQFALVGVGSAPDLSDYAKKTDLIPYAKTTDPTQVLTVKSVVLDGIKFNGSGEVLTPITDDYGTRLRLIPQDWGDPNEFPIVIAHTDIRDLLGGGRIGMTEQEVIEARTIEIREILTGGADVPPNVDWTPCVKVAGAGVVQAKLTNGVAQLSGRLDYKQPNTGSYATVQKLPDGFPRPKTEIFRAAYAVNTNVSYRIALVRIGPDGSIGVSAPTGVFDWLEFGGVQFPVF